jgi:hypothetical protein
MELIKLEHMKNTFLKYIKITLALLLFLQVGKVSAQNNLTMRAYQTSLVGDVNVDGATLDQVFGTVTINGTVVTGNYNTFTNYRFADIPTTVSGFGGVQVVYINGYKATTGGDAITTAQADALIDYVKGGGILIGNIEGFAVSPSDVRASKYIGEALLCNSVTLTATAGQTAGPNPAPAYHPGNGALLLNNLATSLPNSGSYSYVSGLPSENVIYRQNLPVDCSTIRALEFVIPAYPGSISPCGVNGMGLFSGEVFGILTTSTTNRSASNKNYAQLIFDFLYNPTAMATRRAWSTISTNTNTTCPPALSPPVCAAGKNAPTLSATTLTAACPANSMNLNSLVSSTTPSGASLVWFTNNSRTGSPVPNPTAVTVSGTYFAFYYDATNTCYSPASAAVTTTACPLNVATTCPAVSVDLASRVTSTAPSGYTYTFHSGTPATSSNKLTSSVVNTAGTYYLSAYFAGQDCYTNTSRPMVVTITNCCATITAPSFN